MSNENTKYAVKPEVLKQIKFNPRDKELSKSSGTHENTLIQGVVSTPPEQWNEGQLAKAKKYELHKRTAEEIRYLFDNEVNTD